jgi:KaiC/GvpD/RAD55 family RecA-like ATPase
VPTYIERGLLRFVDTYSRTTGAEEEHPCAEYVDGTLNLNALSGAIDSTERKVLEQGPRHRVVFDSLPTLLAYTNAQTTFRFLQVLIGKARRAGAISMMLLETGMHADADVQMLKHLMDGTIEAKPENGKLLLKMEGIGVTESRGWVEYRFSEQGLEITGSFAAGRIR